MVETVAHAKAALKYYPGATFLLDIGGQDMKAVWLKDGIITNIVVNEACSSGCGSFLENFASTLHIPVEKIAQAAFKSEDPAVLGSPLHGFYEQQYCDGAEKRKAAREILWRAYADRSLKMCLPKSSGLPIWTAWEIRS